jgi:hypothetical protein
MLKIRGSCELTAKLRQIGRQTFATESCGDSRSDTGDRPTGIPGCIAKNLSYLLLHAATVSLSESPQSSLHVFFDIPHNELGHCEASDLNFDIMISRTGIRTTTQVLPERLVDERPIPDARPRRFRLECGDDLIVDVW